MASLFRKKKSAGRWIVRYYDHTGRRRDKATGTTDRRAAERIARRIESQVALVAAGEASPDGQSFREAAGISLATHLADYIAHWRASGRSEKHLIEKERHFRRLTEEMGLTRLAEVTADVLERHLRSLEERGLSARTVNMCRQHWVAFLSWCLKRKRIKENPLTLVAIRDESKDKRHERRPLTHAELGDLLAVAAPAGRAPWYFCAALAGLRKSELLRLEWRDIDFELGAIKIREPKSGLEGEVVPLHPQLADSLRIHRPVGAGRTDRVFPQVVTDATRRKDFLRAGLAYEEEYVDESGKTKKRIVTRDDEGRVIDLHAMRKTLGTSLARAGVPPQVAQEILRHADYRTTQRHYTALSLQDAARGIQAVPSVGASESGGQLPTVSARAGA